MEGDEGKKSENFRCSGGWEQSVWGGYHLLRTDVS